MIEKDEQLPQARVSLVAPIVLDHQKGPGLESFLGLMQGLKSTRNTVIAAVEARRLAPYFAAMSCYLKRELRKTAVDKDLTARMEKLLEPKAITFTFNMMAACTRNTLTSEMILASTDLMESAGPAQSAFTEQQQFQTLYGHGGFSIRVGFLQVRAEASQASENSSTTVPVCLIDKKVVAAIKDYAPEPMLQALQRAFTMVNHDMLHHLTSPVLNSDIASRYDDGASPIHIWAMHTMDATTQLELDREWYEHWAQMSHEKVLLESGVESAGFIADAQHNIDVFFDELERIGAEMMDQEKTAEPLDRVAANKIIDFMGMTMGHALARVFPLDHAVMQHCFARMEKADLDPTGALRRVTEGMLIGQDVPPGSEKKALRNFFNEDAYGKRILDSYKAAGSKIIPAWRKISYAQLKMLEIARMNADDTLAHAPKGFKAQKNVGKALLGMIGAATEVAQITAKPPKPG